MNNEISQETKGVLVNVPLPYEGTDEQRKQNYLSHAWSFDGGDMVCGRCDVKTWHISADYPCGADVPRHDVEVTL